MKKTIVLTSLLSALAGAPVYAQDFQPPPYRFQASLVESQPHVIDITYQNRSQVSHCLLASDIDSQLDNDDFAVVSADGEVAYYTGEIALPTPNSRLNGPFFVLLPNDKIETRIDLAAHYEMERDQSYTVNYFMAVIDCRGLIVDKIGSPYPNLLRGLFEDNDNDLGAIMTWLGTHYENWVNGGFIARMTPLSVPAGEPKPRRSSLF